MEFPPRDFKSLVSTNFTTRAIGVSLYPPRALRSRFALITDFQWCFRAKLTVICCFSYLGVEWRPHEIRWFVDNKEYSQVTAQNIKPYPWAYDERPFHLILNLTLGGSLGGKIEKSDPPRQFTCRFHPRKTVGMLVGFSESR